MKWASLPAVLMAAVSLYAGIIYLWLYIRRRAELHNLWFAFTCLSIALYDVFCAGLYNASSLEQGMFWQRFQFASIALFTICFSWFVFFFTRFREGRPFYITSVILSVFIVLGLLLRGEITLSLANPSLKHIKLWNFIDITYFEVQPGLFYLAQYLAMFFVVVLGFYVVIWFYRNSEDRRRSPLVIAMISFLLASINDSLVGAGVYPFVFLMEYAYLFVIIFMAYVLQNNFIDLTQEVEELNIQLEEKVNERTMELLFSEIGRGLYADMLKELPDPSAPEDETGEMPQNEEGDTVEDHLSTVRKLSQDISIILNFETMMGKFLDKALDISHASSGYILMVNGKGSLSIQAASEDAGGIEKEVVLTVASAVYAGKKALITGGSVTPPSEIELPEEILDRIKNSVILCAPVYLRKDIIGVGFLERRESEGEFSDADGRVLSSFMNQAVDAMEYAFLYQRMINQKMVKKADYNREPTLTGATEEKIKKALSYIEENYSSDISREGLAASLNMHPDSLGRFFKMYTDRKISEYINELRVKKAAQLLRESEDNIIDIAFSVGFESVTTFNRAFMKEMKVTPTKYRKNSL